MANIPTPSQLSDQFEEPAAGGMKLVPPANGHIFRISEIAPGFPGALDAAAAAAMLGAMGLDASGESEPRAGSLSHRTETLDYGLVLEGEIVLILDHKEVTLKAGDVVIQRGSNRIGPISLAGWRSS